MKLITKELRKKIPKTYSQPNELNPMAYVKLFTPWADWTWFIMEMDDDGYCFGLVHGFEKELGYFHLDELAEITGPAGLKIERDKWFEPTKYKDIKVTT